MQHKRCNVALVLEMLQIRIRVIKSHCELILPNYKLAINLHEQVTGDCAAAVKSAADPEGFPKDC